MVEKSADALRTIGEMAEALAVRPHILRYWEEQFPMLKPLTRAGGRRLYRPEDVALLHTIHRLLYSEGYTVKGARRFLTLGEELAPVASVADTPVASAPTNQPNFEAIRAVRDRLAAALAAA